MSQAVAKICRRCGRDVSAEKRVKDAAGNYYCQPCHAAGTRPPAAAPPAQSVVTPTPTCSSCGAAVAEDAAFCARCGAKREGNLSVDDEIDVTSIIAELRRYAELSTVLVTAPGVNAQAEETLRQMAVVRDTYGMARLNDLVAQARMQEASCRREAEKFKTRIGVFDHGRVQRIYDLILSNPTVSDTIKDGLRSDALHLFGRAAVPPAKAVTATTSAPVSQRAVPQARQTAPAHAVRETPVARRARRGKGLDPRPPVIGMMCLLVACIMGFDKGASPGQVVAAALIALAGTATILTWAIVAIVRKSRGQPLGGASPVTRASSGVPDGPSKPVGIMICGGMIVVGGLCFVIAAFDFSQTPVLTSFAVKTACVGVGCVIAALIGFVNSCPKCHLLFTSEVLNTDLVGTHTESRTEERTARHYHAAGGPAYGETRYDVERQVQVTTLVHTKQCKSCGHVWLAKEQRES